MKDHQVPTKLSVEREVQVPRAIASTLVEQEYTIEPKTR